VLIFLPAGGWINRWSLYYAWSLRCRIRG